LAGKKLPKGTIIRAKAVLLRHIVVSYIEHITFAYREIMESTKFKQLRKRLGKTQKELAELLGTSLKAICSYEQGWRSIPTHIERQIYFLLSRKADAGNNQKNCWDILDCPDERKHKCPAWEFRSGKLCWFINGTICECKSKKNWEEKIEICRECAVTQDFL